MTTLTRKMIMDVIADISNSYEGIEEDELIEKFNGILSLVDNPPVKKAGKGKGKSSSVPVNVSPGEELSEETLKKLTVVQIKELLKARKLKVGGKKQELIDRLLGRESDEPKEKPEKKKVSFGTEKRITVKDKRREANAPVIQKLEAASRREPLRRTDDGKMIIHVKTQLVFEMNEDENGVRKAYGVRNPNGDVDPLTLKDIENCKLFNFPYILPENLASKDDEVDGIDELDGEEDGVNEEELVASEDDELEDDEEELTDDEENEE